MNLRLAFFGSDELPQQQHGPGHDGSGPAASDAAAATDTDTDTHADTDRHADADRGATRGSASGPQAEARAAAASAPVPAGGAEPWHALYSLPYLEALELCVLNETPRCENINWLFFTVSVFVLHARLLYYCNNAPAAILCRCCIYWALHKHAICFAPVILYALVCLSAGARPSV